MVYLYGTSVESYRKGWFPGLTVHKNIMYELLKDIRIDGE